jgi:MFS family permease
VTRGHGSLLLVVVHAVVIQIITFAMRPAFSYAVLDLDGAPILLGLLSAAFAVPALLLALPAGHAIDRIGERPALVLGSICVIAAAVVAALSGDSLVALVVAAILLGIGHLLSVIGEQSIVAKESRRGNFDSRFGLYTFMVSLGQTLGPMLLALPGGSASAPPLGLIFTICAGFGAGLLGVSLCVRSVSRMPVGNGAGMLRTAAMLLRTPGLPRALLAGSIVLSSVDLFLAYVPALGRDRGLAAIIVSAMLVARSLFSMLSRLLLGRIVGRFGRRRVLVWFITASAMALGALAVPVPAAVLFLLSAVYGFTVGTCQPITMSWISELSVPRTRGLAMSLRLASNRLGQTALPVAVGAWATVAGAPGVFLALGVVLVAAAWSSNAVGEVSNGEGPRPLREGE